MINGNGSRTEVELEEIWVLPEIPQIVGAKQPVKISDTQSLRRFERISRQYERYGLGAKPEDSDSDLRTYEEALDDKDSVKWLEA